MIFRYSVVSSRRKLNHESRLETESSEKLREIESSGHDL